ncbi:MAG: ATP-binding protein [Burkholderiales bacterium]
MMLPRAAPAERPQVLVVDDSPESLELLAHCLADTCDVRVAADGDEALRLAADEAPDLILLDVMMPGKDGFQVLAALRENLRLREVPVLFVTARHETACEVDGLRAGAVDFLAKPAAREVVQARVALHLALREQRLELQRLNAALEDVNAKLEHQVRVRTQAISESLAKALAGSRAKTAFLATMSHELRTPLNGILGMTELALRRATDPRQVEQLQRSRQSAQRLLSCINNILDLTYIDGGQLTLRQAPFRLGGIVDPIDATYAPRAAEKGLGWWLDAEPEFRERVVVGDQERLLQALGILVDNAVKFTDSGQVTVSAAAVEQGGAEVEVAFAVYDSGIGIDAADQAHLFASFEQVDSSNTRRFGGTGVGLAIAKRLAELMGGSVTCESAPGAGSTFRLVVRLERPAAPDESGAAN